MWLGCAVKAEACGMERRDGSGPRRALLRAVLIWGRLGDVPVRDCGADPVLG